MDTFHDRTYDVIVIGAGAAGLQVARTISAEGMSVLIVEARERIGGRIHTISNNNFSVPIECGAEFVHGEAAHTRKLLRAAEVRLKKGTGAPWTVKEGKIVQEDLLEDDWKLLINAMEDLQHDVTMGDLLQSRFGGPEYTKLRDAVVQFVQDFDVADVDKISAFALREEWTSANPQEVLRPEGGYSQLIDVLYKECIAAGAMCKLQTIVRDVKWSRHSVCVTTATDEVFTAHKLVITVPPSVLQTGVIRFSPAITEHEHAWKQIETGGVVKFIVEFHDPYWENGDLGFRQLSNADFIFSDEPVPTWWTQKPTLVPLLTGWLSGPPALQADRSEESLRTAALNSLSRILGVPVNTLTKGIRAFHHVNWLDDPFACGAYAYKTLRTPAATAVLAAPVESTLYFAGEAYNEGPEMGTVEAALSSGAVVAAKVLAEKIPRQRVSG